MTSTPAPTTETADSIRAEAEAAHAAYPQYAGHWDGWLLGRMRRTIRRSNGRGFVLATEGEMVLVDPNPGHRDQSPGFVTVYSRSYAASDIGMCVSMRAKDVEIVR